MSVSTVWYLDDTSIFTGLTSDARWSFWTLLVIVAEKRYLCGGERRGGAIVIRRDICVVESDEEVRKL
jgi:hypothetical protein